MLNPIPQDHIRMIRVEFSESSQEFVLHEVMVRPKTHRIEKELGEPDRTEGIPLLHVFPGHAMRAVRDQFYGKRQKWTFSTPDGCLDVFFQGPALIYGMTKSVLSPCLLTLRQVEEALTEVDLKDSV